MLIPLNTDAPLRHLPIVTVGLIFVNTLVFFGVPPERDLTPHLLTFGHGLHPLQWITSVFLHANFLHLLGNMVFLWAFGMVIEGRVGWWRFLLIYLGLGAFESAIAQIVMLKGHGAALGASGAIYGLVAMALVWAPRSCMSCLCLFGLRPFFFDLPILWLATGYLFIECATVALGNFTMSSAMLHLAGAAPGLVLAAVLLKLGLVDCEDYDLFAVLGYREGKAAGEPNVFDRALQQRRFAEKITKAILSAHKMFAQDLAEGRPEEALALHQSMSQSHESWRLEPEQLAALIKSLLKQQAWEPAMTAMTEYVHQAPDGAPQIRLRLAEILLDQFNRSAQAMGVLEAIRPGVLTADQMQLRDALSRRAIAAYSAGEIDVESPEI